MLFAFCLKHSCAVKNGFLETHCKWPQFLGSLPLDKDPDQIHVFTC